MATAEKRKDKAKKRVVTVEAVGEAHIKATFNNIIIAMTNSTGQVVSWASAGKMGFKGSKKNTPYAAQMAAQDCASKAYELGLRKVEVGFDYGRGAEASDIVLYSEFDSRDALAGYETHAEHLALVPMVRDVRTEKRVVDYEV